MTDDEKAALAALERLLDMTDRSDWPLVYRAVEADVAAGKYGAEFAEAFLAMVDSKLPKRRYCTKEGQADDSCAHCGRRPGDHGPGFECQSSD